MLVEAINRIGDDPDVPGVPVLVMGCVGLVVNLVVLLHAAGGPRESMNVRGAYLEVFADSLGSLGVVVAAVVLLVFDWEPIDAIIGVAIGLFMVPRTLRLGVDALRVLARGGAGARRRRRAARRPRRASPASSTCTTCTCGRSRARWTSPPRT